MSLPFEAPSRICFMVMPYGVKATNLDATKGPVTVDFDALWNRVYRPLIEEDLGYEAVRGDEELSPLILDAMIESLALSDLVIADISIPNANVYYEIGLRHGARSSGCVLVTADWAAPAFDLGQVRHVRFPLVDGAIPDADAGRMREVLLAGIRHQRDQPSVLHAVLPGFPDTVDAVRTARFRTRMEALRRIAAELNSVRLAERSQRASLALAAVERLAPLGASSLPIAMEIIHLLRDVRAWEQLIAFVEALPLDMRNAAMVQEQVNLARSHMGDHLGAISALQALIASNGDSAERRGLLGGRYKRLFDGATDAFDREQYLDLAIEAYTQGMLLDLNDYYPMSNLARLLRLRGGEEDAARATEAATATIMACRRALARNPTDAWVRPTLLCAAFDAGNVSEARRLASEVRRAGAGAFHLDTTISELERAVATHTDAALRNALSALIDELRVLLRAFARPE